MQCGFHAYMESWGLAVDNPYYQLTESERRILADRCATRRLYADGLASGRGNGPRKENHGSGQRIGSGRFRIRIAEGPAQRP